MWVLVVFVLWVGGQDLCGQDTGPVCVCVVACVGDGNYGTKFLEGIIPDYKGPMALHDKARRVRTTVEHVKGWNGYILWAPVGKQ